ncbi:DoxX family protein [Arcanobacterium wilhelmae]|uniref:DoxX family protein n=1 Tax=Arcanobacterium wilhelmae TaxID=1803177 RepID=UPI00241541EB|nr:DoxX family protein [Arcanobacterium wilhelmae]WFN91175.1 DoxX family protein [Arcanobacterium wilhelmae]
MNTPASAETMPADHNKTAGQAPGKKPARPQREDNMKVSSIVNFAGRVALALPFIILGSEAAREPGARVNAVKKAPIKFAQDHADELVRFNGAAMVAGGLGVASGVLPHAAALGLVAATAPTTVAGHDYWNVEDPAQRGNQRIHFLKNIAMIGGALILASQYTRKAKSEK